MIDLKELNKLLDKATPGPWETEVNSDDSFVGTFSGKMTDPYDGHLPTVDTKLFAFGRKWPSRETKLEDAYLIVALRNNAKELIRLAEIGKRYEESDGMIPFNIFGANSEGKTNIGNNVR